MPPRVVVYGLLRRGESMSALLTGATHVGLARVPGIDLFDLGPYPAAVAGTGVLVGDVYLLPDAATLKELDAAEGCDRTPPLYRRAEVEALGERAWIYLYARDVAGAPRITSGDWLNP